MVVDCTTIPSRLSDVSSYSDISEGKALPTPHLCIPHSLKFPGCSPPWGSSLSAPLFPGSLNQPLQFHNSVALPYLKSFALVNSRLTFITQLLKADCKFLPGRSPFSFPLASDTVGLLLLPPTPPLDISDTAPPRRDAEHPAHGPQAHFFTHGRITTRT